MPRSVRAQLAAIERRRERDVMRVAAEVRKNLVIPACKTHGLRYRAGNGLYFFLNEKGEVIDSTEPHLVKRYGLKRVFKVLDLEPYYRATDNLGGYIADYPSRRRGADHGA